jgi:hypothetical protein
LANKVFSLAEVARFNRKIRRRLLTAIANPHLADNHFVLDISLSDTCADPQPLSGYGDAGRFLPKLLAIKKDFSYLIHRKCLNGVPLRRRLKPKTAFQR